MSVIGLKTKNGVNYSGLSSYDDTELRTLINGKVSKQTGKSLIADSQITRLANVYNYDDSQIVSSLSSKVTAVSGQSLISISQINRLAGVSNYNDAALRNLINQKVTAVDGYSMVSNAQIQRLSNVSNYDDSELRQAISSSSANITQAVLNCEIPYDPNSQLLNVTIKLCRNQNMTTDVISLNNLQHYNYMSVALDGQVVPLAQYVGEISYMYFTGTLILKLNQTIENFNPNVPWYALAIWSNGESNSCSQIIQFLHNGFCKMPQQTNKQTNN